MTYKVDDWCGCWLTSCRSIAVWRPQALEHTCMACCGQVLCNTQQQAMKYKRQNSVSGISWNLSEQNLQKFGISVNRIFKSLGFQSTESSKGWDFSQQNLQKFGISVNRIFKSLGFQSTESSKVWDFSQQNLQKFGISVNRTLKSSSQCCSN